MMINREGVEIYREAVCTVDPVRCDSPQKLERILGSRLDKLIRDGTVSDPIRQSDLADGSWPLEPVRKDLRLLSPARRPRRLFCFYSGDMFTGESRCLLVSYL